LSCGPRCFPFAPCTSLFRSPVEGADEDVAEEVVGLGGQLVLAVPVGAVHEEEIDVFAGGRVAEQLVVAAPHVAGEKEPLFPSLLDRKSTRLNSSHVKISYAV